MLSDSEGEVLDLNKQLSAFDDANRMREKVKALEFELGEAYKRIERMERQLSAKDEPKRPTLLCECCDADMAPATKGDDGQWTWEEGRVYECDNCGWKGRIVTDDHRHFELEDSGDDESLDDEEEDGDELIIPGDF